MLYPTTLKSSSTVVILVLLIAFFGGIVLLVLFLRKKLNLVNKDKPTDEKQIADENLSRILEDVDDEDTKKQFEEFEKNNEKKSK